MTEKLKPCRALELEKYLDKNEAWYTGLPPFGKHLVCEAFLAGLHWHPDVPLTRPAPALPSEVLEALMPFAKAAEQSKVVEQFNPVMKEATGLTNYAASIACHVAATKVCWNDWLRAAEVINHITREGGEG